jgi:hypothetical protein
MRQVIVPRDLAHRLQARGGVPRDPQVRAAHEQALEMLLRTAAHQSQIHAPSTLSSAIHRSLTHTSIAPLPARQSWRPDSRHLGVQAAWLQARTLVHYQQLTQRQRHVALGGLSTLALALLCGLGLALDPAEAFTLLGVLSALILSAVAVGHLLSAAVTAILGSGLLAVVAIAIYLLLAAGWVRLVGSPVEA